MADGKAKTMPEHPGEVLLRDFMEPRKLSIKQVASGIGVSKRRISEILNGKRAITADTAVRLSRYLGTTPQEWLECQARYDAACFLQKTYAVSPDPYGFIVPAPNSPGVEKKDRNNKQSLRYIKDRNELQKYFRFFWNNDIILGKTFFSHIIEHPVDRFAREWIKDPSTENYYLRFMQNFAHEKNTVADLIYNILTHRRCTVTIKTPVFGAFSPEISLYAYAIRNICNCLLKCIFNTEEQQYDDFPVLYGIQQINGRYVMIWGEQVDFQESANQLEIKEFLKDIREVLTTPAQCKNRGRTPIDDGLIRNAFHQIFSLPSGKSIFVNPLLHLQDKVISGPEMENEIVKNIVWLWQDLTEGTHNLGYFFPRRKEEKYFKPLSSSNCDRVRDILLEELADRIEDTLASRLLYFDVDKASSDIARDNVKPLPLVHDWPVGFEIAVGASTLKITPTESVENLLNIPCGYSISRIAKAVIPVANENRLPITEENFRHYLYEYVKKHKIAPIKQTRQCSGKGLGNARKYLLHECEEGISSYKDRLLSGLFPEIVDRIDDVQ